MRKPLSTKVFSELVASIYDSAVDPDRWQPTLELLRSALGFANANLGLQAMPSGDHMLTVWAGTDPVWIKRAARYGADIVDLWGGPERLLSYPLDSPVVLSRVRTQSDWIGNRYYLEWAKPQGLQDVMAITVARDVAMVGSVGLGRHELAGNISDTEIDTVRLLIPHLQRAIAIGRLLDIKSVASSAFEAALNALAVAVVLADVDLRIVHANEAARAALASADVPIVAKGGRLVVRPSAVEAALKVAVRQAAEDEMTLGGRGFGIPAVTVNGTPLVLHVLPLRHGPLRSGLAPNAIAGIFVAPARAPMPAAPKDTLAALFDLTPAEARVFAQIASGLTREEAGRVLGIEKATVKSHLSQIFLKTGTRRQSELVALNASVSLPLRR